MSYCDEIPYRRCGDMTYKSYIARKCGKCIEHKEREQKTMEKVKVTLPNGVAVEGTVSQVEATARALGYTNVVGNDGIYYRSTSRGLIRIVDMDNTHLANAIRKLYREWANALTTVNGRELLSALRNGPSDRTFVALVSEYANRARTGRL